VIMIYSVWKYFGFSLVILLAGLGNIDPELYEAAQIDGANAWQSFKRITVPLLSPSLYYVTLIATMGSLRSFDAIYQLSIRASAGSGPGGPLDSTQSLVIYVFNQFWRDHFFGYGWANSWQWTLLRLTRCYASPCPGPANGDSLPCRGPRFTLCSASARWCASFRSPS
jgi:multiple sugar transport system permease protein